MEVDDDFADLLQRPVTAVAMSSPDELPEHVKPALAILASHLLARHYGLALVAVLGVSAVAAACGGWRVARIQASEGIRDV